MKKVKGELSYPCLTKNLLVFSLTAVLVVPALLIENSTITIANTGQTISETTTTSETPAVVSHEPVLSIDFENSDTSVTGGGVESWNLQENNSKVINLNNIGNVLRLGYPNGDITTELLHGVQITNPYAAKSDIYVETLTQALENNGVTYNGSSADLDDNNYLSTFRTDRTYPFPKWKTGVTISAWIKVPSNLTQDTVLLSFSRDSDVYGTGMLYLTAAGDVHFAEGSVNQLYQRNRYLFNYTENNAILNNLINQTNEWVYVTMTIENDYISLYYNGIEAPGHSYFGYEMGRTSSKQFNKGFSYRGATPQLRFANYRDLLNVFLFEDKDCTDFSDYSKYTFLNSSLETLMEFLTDEQTKLYIGGTSSDIFWGVASFTDATAGLMMDDINFYGYPMNDTDALLVYQGSSKHIAGVEPTADPTPTPRVTPTPSDTPTDSPSPVTDTPTPVTNSPSPVTQTPVPTIAKGDLDGNGSVELADANMVLKAALNITSLTSAQKLIADVDGNNSVELADANMVLKAALNITTLQSFHYHFYN